jgi:hypothetical protein
MSEFSNELEERLTRNALISDGKRRSDLTAIRFWYFGCMRAYDVQWVDLSALERVFMTEALNGPEYWQFSETRISTCF